jgi:hypothetical protein
MTSEDRAATPSGGAAVTFDRDDESEYEYVESVGGHYDSLLVVGHGRIVAPKHEIWVAPESVVSAADIASLHVTVLEFEGSLEEEPAYIDIALESDPEFHARSSPRDPVRLMVNTDGVFAVFGTTTRREPPWRPTELARLLAPAVEPHGCAISVTWTVNGLDPDTGLDKEMFLPGEWEEWRERVRSDPHEIHVAVSAQGDSTVAPLLAAGRDASALLTAYERGEIDVIGARHLIRAGRAHLLTGLAESGWLEVKGGPYRLSAQGAEGTRAAVELAQDVARFANGDCDSILLIGFKEKKDGKTARLDRLAPVPLDGIDPDQHRSVIDARVVPPIDGLLVERIDTGNDQGLLLISVPPQPSEIQPYLVHGVVVGDKNEGAFFSIVRRRGEASIPTTAAQIHAYIVAGKAVPSRRRIHTGERIRRLRCPLLHPDGTTEPMPYGGWLTNREGS